MDPVSDSTKQQYLNVPVCHAGSTRGLALAWTTAAFFAGFAGVSAFGPIVSQLKNSLALNSLLAGILVASPAFTGSLLRIPFGAIVDRVGGKKPLLVLLGLSALGLAGMTALFLFFENPVSSDYFLFLLAGCLCGCGIASFSVGVPAVSYWYPQNMQGTSLAIYAGLGNLAPGIFAAALPIIVVSYGLAQAYGLWLAFLGLLIVAFWIFMKDAPYFQYKEKGIEVGKDVLLDACGEELIPSGKAMESFKKAACDWRTWVLTLLYFTSFGGFVALTVWFPTYWVEKAGVTMVRAGFFTSLYSISTSLFRIAGGFASDRLGGEKVVVLSFGLTAGGAGIMMNADMWITVGLIGEMVLALGMGLANGAVFKLVPKYSPTTVGGTAGIVGGLGAFGGFVIPPIMGLFVANYGARGYGFGFTVFLGLSVIGIGLVFVLLRKPTLR